MVQWVCTFTVMSLDTFEVLQQAQSDPGSLGDAETWQRAIADELTAAGFRVTGRGRRAVLLRDGERKASVVLEAFGLHTPVPTGSHRSALTA